jgi:uncharacterized membrane protein YidH (DUF202 family)
VIRRHRAGAGGRDSEPGGHGAESGKPVSDVGLQPERTALAWRRTALALAVGSLIGARVLSEDLGVWAAAPAALGVVAAVAVFVVAQRRYRSAHHALTRRPADRPLQTSGLLPLVVSVSLILGGLAATASVIVTAAR